MAESLDAAEWFLKRVLIGGVILLIAVLALGFAAQRWLAVPPQPAPAPGAQTSTTTVSLRVDFPADCRLTYAALSFAPNMTVLDAMKAASARPAQDRPLRFDSTGSGDTAFITRIEDTPSQGGGKASRNWQFWINGHQGTTGVGATILQPNDRITWVFEPYTDNPAPPGP